MKRPRGRFRNVGAIRSAPTEQPAAELVRTREGGRDVWVSAEEQRRRTEPLANAAIAVVGLTAYMITEHPLLTTTLVALAIPVVQKIANAVDHQDKLERRRLAYHRRKRKERLAALVARLKKRK